MYKTSVETNNIVMTRQSTGTMNAAVTQIAAPGIARATTYFITHFTSVLNEFRATFNSKCAARAAYKH